VVEPLDPDRWRTIEEVLDAALDLPRGRRSELLDEACAGDQALRAEVESLLAAHDEAGDYLETPVGSFRSIPSAVYRPGQRVGPYRLLERIGRGGLGVVYLAVDTRLGRRVALKLLPASRTDDPDARARLHREARAASTLDHPNICTIYEMGESEAGDPFIAMAHIEGEPLNNCIARGPLPLPKAVDIAVQTASGLTHAHEKGIVHRDIKPANLIVTPEGQVGIVDFGLAKGKGTPTLTREGVTPGTVAYMSPEQIRGEKVDRRADIWALGVVLYEMITGRAPFRGEDEQSRIYSILNQDPEPLTALRAGVPLGMEPVLAKALAKNPEERYQHVDELPVDLRRALSDRPGPIPGVAGSARKRVVPRGLMLVLGGAALGVVLTSVVPDLRNRGAESTPSSSPHLSVALPPDQTLAAGVFRRFALSPDGKLLVYAARSGEGQQQLFVRPLDRAEARPIAGTADAQDPFFSPDGRWVGFFADEELRKVSLEGGAPLKICDAPTATSRGASWGPDGTIILPLGQLSGLFRVSDSGGTPEPLTVPGGDPGRSGHFFPQVLPRARSVLFTIWSGSEWSTAILRLETGEWEEAAKGCAAARYVATGHMICAEMRGVWPTGNLLIAPLDPEQPIRAGSFVSLSGSSAPGEFDFATSDSGTLVYATGGSGAGQTAAVWVDRTGSASPLAGNTYGYMTPSLSPDGKELVVARIVEAGREEVWLHDVETGTAARLSTTSYIDNLPLWWPDGERVVFNSLRRPPGLYQVSPDLRDSSALVLQRGRQILVPGSFSPDGRVLAYTELNDRTLGDLWTFSLDDGSVTPVVRSPWNERTPAFSPDGRWLAFASNESGVDQVYVQAYPGPGPPMQISTDGGREPVWSRDGTELFYRHTDRMMAVPVREEGSFVAGRPIELFEGPFASEYKGKSNYDVAPDGRFLMVQVEEGSEPVRLDVILNWFDELARPPSGGGG